MKKALLAVIFMILSFASIPAVAEISTHGLSETQKAQLVIQAEEMKKAATKEVVPEKVTTTLESASKWAEIGKGLAVGIGAGAKEIGVAVNDFADSRVGRITTYIIVWKYMGADIMAVIMSLCIMFIIMPGCWFVFKHLCFKYEYENASFFGITYRVKKSTQIVDSDAHATVFLAMCFAELILFVTVLIVAPF